MRKILVCAVLLIVALSTAAISQEKATIIDLSGKVEVKNPGKGWVPARDGMEILGGTIISTGFGGTAVLDLGSSEIRIKQLTRMTLDELTEQEGTVSTQLTLNVGRVSAKVKTTEGLTHNFTLRSPTSTASVRGTEFDFDGFMIRVKDGRVSFLDETGTEELVFEGEISGGEAALNRGFAVSPYTSYSGSDSGILSGSGTGSGFTGTIVVEISS